MAGSDQGTERDRRARQLAGSGTALAEARYDPRVDALALDSMHTRIRYQMEARVDAEYVAYFGTTWAIVTGIQLPPGVDVTTIDAEDTIGEYGVRPLLLIHGTGDTEDLPARTQALFNEATARGIPRELYWCPDSGHNASAGMPVKVCRDEFAGWTRDFFDRALVSHGP